MTDNYSFQLSFAEFIWLTHVFGLNRLPLLDATYPISRPFSSAALSEGQSSLQGRGFIRKNGGVNWQVDHLPAAIMRWLGDAESMLSVQHRAHGGSHRHAVFFIKEEAGLSMIEDASGYRCTIYPDHSVLVENMIDWLAIPFPKTKQTLPIYSIPQPEEVIPIAWRDSARAAKAFTTTSITTKQLRNTFAWIKALQCYDSITYIQLSNDIAHSASRGAVSETGNIPGASSLRKTAQIIVCNDKKNVWGAYDAANSAEFFSLSSIDRKDLRMQIQNLL